MALTATFVKNIKPTAAASGDKHTDGLGLYLHVKQAGKYWRVSYRFDGKQKLLSLGVYPAVSLAKSRQWRDKARELLADGIDPSIVRKAGKLADAIAASNTFELVAREFHQSKCESWSPSYAAKWLRGLEKDQFPYLGSLPPATITAPVLLSALPCREARSH